MQRASSQSSLAISFLGLGDQVGALGAQLLADCEACWLLHLLPLEPPYHPESECSLNWCPCYSAHPKSRSGS